MFACQSFDELLDFGAAWLVFASFALETTNPSLIEINVGSFVERAFARTNDTAMLALSSQLARTRVDDGVIAPPSVSRDLVFIYDRDGNVTAFRVN